MGFGFVYIKRVKGIRAMRHTKAAILQQFRYNWKVFVKQEPQWKGDVVAKREKWNNFTDMLCKEGYITENQYNNWTNPF